MIFILSGKSWLKDCKKLVGYRDYLILDATDGDETKMSQFSQVVAMDNFCVPAKLLSEMARKIGDEIIDLDRVEVIEKEFFRSTKFATCVLATMRAYLCADSEMTKEINVFIIVRNKAFKYYRKRFASEFCRVFPDAAPLLFIYDEDKKEKMKKALQKELTVSDRHILEKDLRKKEIELEKRSKPEIKKKKKNKKKRKNKGWGFLDGKDYDDF